MNLKLSAAAAVLAVALLPVTAAAAAREEQPAQPVSGEAAGASATSRLDSWIADRMRRRDVPGAVVVVVDGGKVTLRKGYGVADLRTKQPVDPARTCFHVGSVSKVLTATAVAQAVGRGEVDPGVDVNRYLDGVTVPGATLDQLATHTAGYEQHVVGTGADGAQDWVPFTDYLREHPVERERGPGESIIYSSVGMAVAGQAVADAAGLRFGEYMSSRLFEPLGMTRSSYPTPGRPAAGPCAVGYRASGAERVAYPEDYYSLVPGGGDAVTTGDDMARFLLAHLGGGRPEGGADGERVLTEEALRLTHERRVSHGPSIRGRAYGFSEWYEQGHRALFHDGGAPGFLSRVFMVPDREFGFFVSHTKGTDLEFSRELTTKAVQLFHPDADPVPQPALKEPRKHDGQGNPPQPYAGYYRGLDLPEDSFGQLFLSMQAVRVTTDDDGTLYVGRERYRPTADDPGLYWSGGPNDAVTFTPGYLHRGTATLQQLSWWEAPTTQLGALAVFVLAFLAIGVTGLVRRPRINGRLLLAAAAAVNLVFAVGVAYAVSSTIGADPMLAIYGIPSVLSALLVLPFVSSALVVGATVRAGLGRQRTTRAAKVYVVGACLVTAAFTGYLNAWNLLGWYP